MEAIDTELAHRPGGEEAVPPRRLRHLSDPRFSMFTGAMVHRERAAREGAALLLLSRQN